MERPIRSKWLLFSSSLIVLFLWGGCKLPAQKVGKEDIRNSYREANSKIERCKEEGAPCGLFHNSIQTNSGEEPWAVVGNYRSTRDLWYVRDESSEEEHFQLLKVNTATHRSSRLENEEYLFSEAGQLQFCYFRMSEGGEVLQEYRYYFIEGKLIDYVEKLAPEEAEYREWSESDAEKIQAKARALQELLEATL